LVKIAEIPSYAEVISMARKRGRPTEYDPERHPFLVMCLAREGLTEKEMAQKLGIGKTTLTRWKQEHPEFRASLNGSREEADLKVVDSLYRRAIGYEFEETEMVVTAKDGEEKPAKEKRVKKHVAPDVTACIFWLKNRRPAEWRDKLQQELTGPGGGPLVVTDDRAALACRLAGIAARVAPSEDPGESQ